MSTFKIVMAFVAATIFMILCVIFAEAQSSTDLPLPDGYTMKSKNVICAPIAQVRKEMNHTGIRIGGGSLETKSGGVIVTDLWITETGMLVVTESPDSKTMCIVSVSQDFDLVEFEPGTLNP